MLRSRSRYRAYNFDRLEPRALLSLAGVWLGQDGTDLVGRSSYPGPDDVQDVHLRLSGLPAERSITFLEVSGYGGGNWQFNGPYGPWRAEVVRTPAAPLADLYFAIGEPEIGRQFQVTVRYDTGAQDIVYIAGGTADPNLPMPHAQLLTAWIGQDGSDRTGPGAAVGPDGAQDARIELQRLSATIPIDAVTITASDGRYWTSGINPTGRPSAEFLRRPADPTRGDLYFQPTSSLSGRSLTIQVHYAGGRVDQDTLTSGSFDPTRSVASSSPFPTVRFGLATAWIGQDGNTRAGLGSARFTLSGLPPGRQVQGAILSNSVGATWAFRAPGGPDFPIEPDALHLAWQAGPTAATADLAFVPIRDETDSDLTLRILFDDGSIGLASLAAGPTDPAKAAPTPATSSITAYPGDNLQDLVDRHGTVTLSPGTYNLSAPLILNHPVNLVASALGPVTLRFTQPPTASAWSSAIQVHAGNSTLRGFSIRFSGPVRWDWGTPFGPALIATTDLRTGPVGTPKVGLRFDQLDLESPPAASAWEEAPRLINLASARSGAMTGNILRGGSIEFAHGPWLIQDNAYRGTPQATYAWSVFSGHSTHDLQLLQNHAEPVGTSGKTWRFLVLTTRGANNLISQNTVIGIGPRDSDSIHENANEILLTESYRIRFEGRPLALSSDGRILRIPSPQGESPRAGDLLAILAGPDAGSYRRVLQTLDPTTLLLDQPISSDTSAISLAPGFVDSSLRDNLIDSRGSSVAMNLVLVGNHFGTLIENNRFLGGFQAFKITAAPTEQPVHWGWSRAPLLGVSILGNTLEDAAAESLLAVEHGPFIKSTSGRVYLSATLDRNIVRWSSAFRPRSQTVIDLGTPGSLDPREFQLTLGSTVADARNGLAPNLRAVAALINGNPTTNQIIPLLADAQPVPPAPGSVRLLVDTGTSHLDRRTSDGRIAFEPGPHAARSQFSLNSGPWLDVPDPRAFLPTDLIEGTNSLAIRSLNSASQPGPSTLFSFQLDRLPPPTPSVALLSSNGQLQLTPPDPETQIQYALGDAGFFLPAPASGPFQPPGLLPGWNTIQIRASDPAGNHSSPVIVRPFIRFSPATGTYRGQLAVDRVGRRAAPGPDGYRDMVFRLDNLPAELAITSLNVKAQGGDDWSFPADSSTWRAEIVRSAGSSQADVSLQPARTERGRRFLFTISYADGSVDQIWVQGGSARPSARMPRNSVTPISDSPDPMPRPKPRRGIRFRFIPPVHT